MSLTDDIKQWWHEFIDHLFKHPQAETVAHPAIAAVAQAAQPAPSTITVPGTDRTIDRGVASLLGVSEQASQTLNDRAAHAPAAGGLPPGPVLDAFGVPKVGNYAPGYVWQLAAVADKMHFDISSYPGQVAALATVTIKDAAGNAVIGPVQANPNQWSSPSFAGTPGMTAEVVMDKPGPGIATTYKDD